MKRVSSNTILIIIIPIALGFLSGIMGWLLLGVNILNLPFLAQYDLGNANNTNRQIVIDQPRNVVVQQDLQLLQLQNTVLPALVNIYPFAKTDEAYLPSQILGQGFVLTADGWVVTTGDSIKDLKGKYKIVGYQGKEYDFGSFIQDEATGLVFGKISASNLTVAGIGASKDLQLGQTVVLVSQRNKMFVSNISKIGYDFSGAKKLSQSSEALNKKIFLNTPLDVSFNGAVVVNLKGQVVGVVSGNGIIMTDYFSNIINQVLSSSKISRAKLGVDYIDLAQVEGMNYAGDKGALISADLGKTSVANGKIKKGDIIKKVNDAELNVYLGLSEAINMFRVGDKVELQFLRDGKAQSVDVVLN